MGLVTDAVSDDGVTRLTVVPIWYGRLGEAGQGGGADSAQPALS